MRVYEHVASSFSSVAPIPLLQARPHPCVVARLFNAALPLLSPWLPRHERRGGFLFCESTYFNKVAVLHFRREERETDCWVNQDLSEHDLPTYAYPQIRKPHPWKAPSSKRVNSSTGGANKLRYVYWKLCSNLPSYLPSSRFVSLWLSDRRFVTLVQSSLVSSFSPNVNFLSDRTGYLTLLYRYFFFSFLFLEAFERGMIKKINVSTRNSRDRERWERKRASKDSSPAILRRDFSYHALVSCMENSTRWKRSDSSLAFQSLPKGIEIIRDLSRTRSTGEFETRLFSFNEVSYLSRGYNYSALCIIQEILLEIENCQTRAGCDQ